jgi:hypothetical protein
MHLEMQFKQQKIVILYRSILPNSHQKTQKIELLANTINVYGFASRTMDIKS